MNDLEDREVLVHVVADVDAGRQIGWNADVAERLTDRFGDIKRAIAAGTEAVATSLPSLSDQPGWAVEEMSASFGVSLTAQAGVLISKAEAGATLEVTVTFKREVTGAVKRSD